MTNEDKINQLMIDILNQVEGVLDGTLTMKEKIERLQEVKCLMQEDDKLISF